MSVDQGFVPDGKLTPLASPDETSRLEEMLAETSAALEDAEENRRLSLLDAESTAEELRDQLKVSSSDGIHRVLCLKCWFLVSIMAENTGPMTHVCNIIEFRC